MMNGLIVYESLKSVMKSGVIVNNYLFKQIFECVSASLT